MNKKIKGAAVAIAAIIIITLSIYAVNMRRETVDPSTLEHLKKTLYSGRDSETILNDGKVIVSTNQKKFDVDDIENIKVTIQNMSEYKLHFPRTPLIEIEIEGNWYSVTGGVMITLGYYVEAGESRTEPIYNFEFIDFEWIPGHYRIIEDILFEGLYRSDYFTVSVPPVSSIRTTNSRE